MTATTHSWTVTAYETYPAIPVWTVEPSEAFLTPDETWTPYMQFRAVLPFPDGFEAIVRDYLNPNDDEPTIITVTTTREFTDGTATEQKTHVLVLRTADIDWKAFTITITAETDECRLDDFARMTTANYASGDFPYIEHMVSQAITQACAGDTSDLTDGIAINTHAVTGAQPWNAGVKAADWIAGAMAKAGVRLWSPGGNKFYLEYANAVNADPVLLLDASVNVKTANEVRSRNNSDWADGLVAIYRWTDSSGVAHETTDWAIAVASAADVTKAVTLTFNDTRFPGGGAASGLLARIRARAGGHRVTAVSDYTARPGRRATIALPTGTTVDHVIRSVTWTYPGNEMIITMRGDS